MAIPTYTFNSHLEDLAIFAATSYRDQVEQLIISEDGGRYSSKLRKLADIYIYNNKNQSFTKNVNRGWRNADGDYVMIVNSDTCLFHNGNLNDLCIKGKVTSPLIKNQHIDRLAGPFFVVPKEVTKERGYLLEEMRTYCSDSEYDHRVKDIFQKVPSVEIYHEHAQTVRALGIEGGKENERDRKIYEQLIQKGRAAH